MDFWGGGGGEGEERCVIGEGKGEDGGGEAYDSM